MAENGRTLSFALLRAWAGTSALVLGGLLVPPVGTFLMTFSPQPALRLARDHGLVPLAPILVAVAATVAGVAGLPAGLLYLASFGVLTAALAACIRSGSSIERAVLLPTFLVAGGLAATLLGLASAEDLAKALRAGLDQGREQFLAVYGRLGEPMAPEIEDGIRSFLEFVLRIGPSLAILLVGTLVLANVALVRLVESRLGVPVSFGDLTRWKSPPALVWLLIAAGYGAFLVEGPAATVALNVLVVVLAIYFCQGLSVVQFYVRRWRSPVWMAALIYVFVAVEWIVASAVVLLGMFDLWVDFRHLEPRPAEEDS